VVDWQAAKGKRLAIIHYFHFELAAELAVAFPTEWQLLRKKQEKRLDQQLEAGRCERSTSRRLASVRRAWI